MPASTVNGALQKQMPYYEIITDCILGEAQVKFRMDKYLPRPNPVDLSEANRLRYMAYITRAVFYNVTKRTLGGLVGQVFSRRPIIEVPKSMQPIIDDATGLGMGFEQLAKLACSYVISKGRTGVHIDYPDTGGTVTRQELLDGDVRPMFTVYRPEDIINWRWKKRGGRNVLTLVVLRGQYVRSDDGFLETFAPEYKVLRLNDSDEYTITTYREDKVLPYGPTVTPTDTAGNPFSEIPFTFIGSENNEPTIDPAPLYDLASLNIAHYRNSADYEESCYISGQPTAWFSGLTEQWVKEVMKGEVQMGSRAAIPLPAGAGAGILQPNPNTLPFEAMKHKETQMVALGAKLVDPAAVPRTATEATIDQSYETSTLSASADNVTDAMTFALKWAARFSGEDEKSIKFELNTEFDLIRLTANERASLIAEWQGNALAFEEMRANLRRAGIAMLDDKKAKETILIEAKERAALAQELMPEPAPGEGEGDKQGRNPGDNNEPKRPNQPAPAGANGGAQ